MEAQPVPGRYVAAVRRDLGEAVGERQGSEPGRTAPAQLGEAYPPVRLAADDTRRQELASPDAVRHRLGGDGSLPEGPLAGCAGEGAQQRTAEQHPGLGG